MIYCIVIGLLVLISFSAMYFRNWINPVVALSLPILFWIFIHSLGIVSYYEINNQTYLYLAVINVIYFFGVISSDLMPYINNNFKVKKITLSPKAVFLLFLVFLVLNLHNFSFANWFSNAVLSRAEFLKHTVFVDIKSMVNNILYGLVVVSFFYFMKTKKIAYMLPLVAVFIGSVFTLGRAVLIIAVINVFYVKMLDQKIKSDRKSIIKYSVIIVASFIVIGSIRGSFSMAGYEYVNVDIVIQKSQHYITGGLSAFDAFFDNYLNGVDYKDNFFLSFMPVIAKIASVFVDVEVNNYRYSAVATPLYTNIYTMFRELISDFGIGGSLIYMYFIGFISGRLYRISQRNLEMTPIILTSVLFTYLSFSIFYSIFLYNFVFATIFLSIFIREPRTNV